MKLKTTAIVLAVLSLSQFSVARTIDDLLVIASAYTELGEDNNYIESKMMTTEEFASYKSVARKIDFDSFDDSKLRHAVATCVFMDEGAYGSHFGEDLRARIIDRFSHILKYRFDEPQPFTMYLLQPSQVNIAEGIFNASCVLAVEADGKALLMQAGAMD